MAGPFFKEHNNLLSLKFAKLYSPKMKSVYWKYFGFPTNEDDRIITKQNVVCTLCHRVLTNHGNTTNLRAHLQFRHKDIFQKICIDNNIKLPSRKVPSPKTTTASNRRQTRKVRMETQDDNLTQDSADTIISIDNDQGTMLYETEIPMTYDDEDDIDRDQFATVEVIKEEIKPFRKMKFNSNHSDTTEYSVFERKTCNPLITETRQDFQIDVIEDCDAFHLQDLIVNMLVKDLRNVRTISDPGMSQLIRTLCGNTEIPSVEKIEEIIKETHSDKATALATQIKAHSKDHSFSLAFDVWRNVEKKHFVSIYINYSTDIPENYNLSNVLYCTFEYNNYTSLDATLAEINLDNCAAAVMNYEYEDYLKEFIRNKDIPIIVSYDVVVNVCLRDVFALSSVTSVFEEVREVLLRYLSELNSKDIEVPNYNDEFPWTAFELLKFFTDSFSGPEDVETLITSSKIIINELTTLSITLDTLRAEDIPLCSMISPITAKILNKKYAPSDIDDPLAAEIKEAITKTLKMFVIENNHLTIAAILDPRFHRLTHVNNFNECIKILTNKQKKLCDTEGFNKIQPKREDVVKQITSNTRKSHLEIFFDIEPTESSSVEGNGVENELQRYRKEVHVSLDESPAMWWDRSGHLYGSLKQLAQCYQCVPCTVNTKFFKKPLQQQIYETQQRFMLTGNIAESILFLNHNSKKLE